MSLWSRFTKSFLEVGITVPSLLNLTNRLFTNFLTSMSIGMSTLILGVVRFLILDLDIRDNLVLFSTLLQEAPRKMNGLLVGEIVVFSSLSSNPVWVFK